MRSQAPRRSIAFVLAIFGIVFILAILSHFLYNNFAQIFFDIINFVQNHPIQAGIIFFIGLAIGWALGRPSY
ncbi:MAG: hypothetical protein ACO2ON_00085 [Candidatus Nanopusillus sp.]